MIFIINSTPLIYLCKAGLNWIFQELETECIIPYSVYEEVIIAGKNLGSSDAFVAEELINKRVISVKDIEKNNLLVGLNIELHRGEIDVLSLAKSLEGVAILDDDIARTAGKLIGVTVHGTIYLIFLMVKSGKLSKEDAKTKLNEMISNGFWMGHKQYLAILDLIDKI
jgi:predicted nucleic acid-binding protein